MQLVFSSLKLLSLFPLQRRVERCPLSMSSKSYFDLFVARTMYLRWYSRYSRCLHCSYFLHSLRNFLYLDPLLNRARTRKEIISGRLSRVDDVPDDVP